MLSHLRAMAYWMFIVALLGVAAGTPASAQQVMRTILGENAGDLFGRAVATMADIDSDGVAEIIISARSDFTNSLPGRAYVYSGATGALIWEFVAEEVGDRFGASVADAGDVDADGVHDIVVGTRSTTSPTGIIEAGAAYVFSGATGLLLHAFYGAEDLDRLGYGVDGAGDIDQDGYDDILAGAYDGDLATGGPGKAYVFSGQTGQIIHLLTGELNLSQFGRVVRNVGDIDADTVPDFMVGAWFHNSQAGKVFVYSGATATLLYSYVGEGAGALFGIAIEGGGDLNQDGVDDLLIGSPQANLLFGRTYVYSGADGTLLQSLTSDCVGRFFGAAVSFTEDFNMDGAPELLIGLPDYWHNPDGPGRVELLSGATGDLMYAWEGEGPGDRFGVGVAGVTDLDQDGIGDLLVSAQQNDEAGEFAGKAYLFSGNDIYLHGDPAILGVGVPMTLTTSGGQPGDPTMLFVSGIDGLPVLFSTSIAGFINPTSQWILQGSFGVDPGLMSLSLRTLVLRGAGNILLSNDELFNFQ